MLTDLLKYGLTLQAEIVAMVAEEVHHRAEDFVRKNADEGYEAYLNSLVGNLEKTVDTLAKPVDTALNGFYQNRIDTVEIFTQVIIGDLK